MNASRILSGKVVPPAGERDDSEAKATCASAI